MPEDVRHDYDDLEHDHNVHADDHVDNDHSTGGDDINGQHNYPESDYIDDDDLHGRHHVNLHYVDIDQYDIDLNVISPRDIVLHYHGADYVLVRRDHLDDLAVYVDAYDRSDYHGVNCVNIIDAARDLVHGANAADAATPGHGG